MKAIDYIKGEYVLFLDGDDYLDLDFVRHMYDFLIYKDADIVVCNFAFVIENSLYIEQKSKFKKIEYNKKDNLLNFFNIYKTCFFKPIFYTNFNNSPREFLFFT